MRREMPRAKEKGKPSRQTITLLRKNYRTLFSAFIPVDCSFSRTCTMCLRKSKLRDYNPRRRILMVPCPLVEAEATRYQGETIGEVLYGGSTLFTNNTTRDTPSATDCPLQTSFLLCSNNERGGRRRRREILGRRPSFQRTITGVLSHNRLLSQRRIFKNAAQWW